MRFSMAWGGSAATCNQVWSARKSCGRISVTGSTISLRPRTMPGMRRGPRACSFTSTRTGIPVSRDCSQSSDTTSASTGDIPAIPERRQRAEAQAAARSGSQQRTRRCSSQRSGSRDLKSFRMCDRASLHARRFNRLTDSGLCGYRNVARNSEDPANS